MADYKGSTTLISGITQKNGGKFPLVEHLIKLRIF